jgi:hypothetical protein
MRLKCLPTRLWTPSISGAPDITLSSRGTFRPLRYFVTLSDPDVGHEYWVSRVSQVRAEPAESAGLTEWQMRGVILALDRNEALTGTRRSS